MAAHHLTTVRGAAVGVRIARSRLELTIRQARASGESLRTIAKEAGVSYETVRTLTK